jgi:hypothetical protein
MHTSFLRLKLTNDGKISVVPVDRKTLEQLKTGNPRKKRNTSMGLTLLIILIVLIVLTFPAWPYSQGWGYGPFGLISILLIILLILILTNVISFKVDTNDNGTTIRIEKGDY